MSLRVFRSELLIQRAASQLAEINEWRAELEAPTLEKCYYERIRDAIDFAAQGLSLILWELACRGEVRIRPGRSSRLELELGEEEPIGDRDPFDGAPITDVGPAIGLDDFPF